MALARPRRTLEAHVRRRIHMLLTRITATLGAVVLGGVLVASTTSCRRLRAHDTQPRLT